MKIIEFLFLSVFFAFLSIFSYADGATVAQTMGGSMDLKITHPDSVVAGREFTISILIENNGWEDKQNISFYFSNPDRTIESLTTNEVLIEKLSTEGSYGTTLDFKILPDALSGLHYLNVIYSQVLVENNEKPLEPTKSNIAIPIVVKEQPHVIIQTKTPETIFPNAQFSFEVTLLSEDIDIKNVKIQIKPPNNIDFIGDTLHTFSTIQKNTPLSISSQIKTPEEQLTAEYRIPFEVIVTYTDDIGDEKTESKTISLLMRPRTFMELTTDGGIWIGDFFIAPYVSLGTIIGIPTGAILSVLIRRSQNKKRKKKTK